jgi:hypothetical protein
MAQAASIATPRWPKNPRHPRGGHRKIKIDLDKAMRSGGQLQL